MRKPTFCICKNKDADQLRSNRGADHAFVFATRIVQSLYFLNPKFQGSIHLLSLHSSVCVGNENVGFLTSWLIYTTVTSQKTTVHPDVNLLLEQATN